MSSLSNYPPETHGGTVTSWVPVGTAYPSSSGCESLFWSVVQGTLAAWDLGYGISVNTNVKCVPSAETTWWNQVNLGHNSLTTLSLGPITCPSAYSTVTTSIGTNTSSTFVACCPPNYSFVQSEDAGITGECESEVPAGEVITYATRDPESSWYITSTSYTTATQAWGIQMNGYNIAPPTTSSSTTSTSATSSTARTPSATPTAQPSSGLSRGAKAGIGVGVALGALALGALIVFIFAHRKRKRIADGGYNLKSQNPGSVAVHELEARRQAGVSELDSRGGREVPAEIDGSRYDSRY